MTIDEAVALSLNPDLSRVGLTTRLTLPDPELLDRARQQADRARQVRLEAAGRGIEVLPWNDARFPSALLAIPDGAAALWYRGCLDALSAPAVAIVGSRAASAVALETATRLAADLAARGVVVVSGLARGVDSAAHRGALQTGTTIAVLGSGLNRIYPREHERLVTDITAAGLVLTEYPPDTPPLPRFFPLRNRLISGLCRAVVVIEASESSGSLITACCALEQGREVMAVPGNVLSGRNRGGHALLRDGAKIVESADDIVEELRLPVAPAASGGFGTNLNASATSADRLLGVMRPGEMWDLDALMRASGLSAAHLLPHLLTLELQGLVARGADGRFVRSA